MGKKEVYEKIDWSKIQQIAWGVAKKVIDSGYKPDVIVGISRGGLVPAKLISDFLQVKDVLTVKADHWGITATENGKARLSYGLGANLKGKKVLLVDDVIDTGESVKLSKRHLKEKRPKDIKTLVLYHNRNSDYEPDFYGSIKDSSWIIFPWNYREDMINLITRITRNKGMSIKKIREELHNQYSLDVSIKELKQILDSVDYFKR